MDEYFKIIRSNKVENMNFIAKFWKYRHVLRYIHKTIYFNFRSLPFRQAVKLPIWLYRPDIVSCKGNVEFGGGQKLEQEWLDSDLIWYQFILKMES